jgi:NitT/TauT family transport system substrate-binding protein
MTSAFARIAGVAAPALVMTAFVAAMFVAAWCGRADADEIVISNFGVSANGMPYGVARAKGFFKEEGANVTGILTSAGGGTSLRNMLAGGVPYGEVNPGSVVAAVLQGADIKIISDTVLTVAEFVWAVRPDSPVKSIQDFKGRKIGYTNARSTSLGLAMLLLEKAGLKPGDAELVRTGGFGEGVAALDTGLVDIAPLPEPLLSEFGSKYRIVVKASEILPPLANVVGVATPNMMAQRGDFIRAVIRARRRAVAFMIANPDEAGDIVAKDYNLAPAVARAAVRNLTTSVTDGVPYWGTGQVHLDGLKRMIEVQRTVGAITGEVDYGKIVETQFLPDDIKAIK